MRSPEKKKVHVSKSSNVTVKAVNARQMNEKQERRFDAALDAWLTTMVKRDVAGQRGGKCYGPTEHQQHDLRGAAPQ
jgi:hypothetical protein